MDENYKTQLADNARTLRKNMTKEERHLWYDFLKALPYNIYRQKVIGNYIVDFYCPTAKIVIEVDGSQHFEIKGKEQDTERDSFLKGLGIKVLRYSNYDVNRNFKYVCQDIVHNFASSTASGPPSP